MKRSRNFSGSIITYGTAMVCVCVCVCVTGFEPALSQFPTVCFCRWATRFSSRSAMLTKAGRALLPLIFCRYNVVGDI